MIELYYWLTPNGHKITMFLEEVGLAYRFHPVDISAGDQFKPEFPVFSPNNRMPAIIDTSPPDGGEPITAFESGAILQYLTDKTGRFLSTDLGARKTVMEWVFWQVGGLGPMAGQNHHFGIAAPEKIQYAIDRYVKKIIGQGNAVWSFVHIDNAVAAPVASLTAKPSMYVVDDDSFPVAKWMPAFAAWVDAPESASQRERRGRPEGHGGDEAIYYHTRLIGASNSAAKANPVSLRGRCCGGMPELASA